MHRFTFRLSLLLLFALTTGCKQSIQPADKGKLNFPFNLIIPDQTDIDGGAFTIISGRDASADNSSMTEYAAQVQMDDLDWPQHLAMTSDGNSITDYYQTVSTSTPLASHTWHVDANGEQNVPEIDHTVPAVEAFDVTSPTMYGTAGQPVTLTWTAPSGGGTHMIIVIDRALTPDHTDDIEGTGTVRIIQPDDNGSYTLTSDDLSGIPAGSGARISLIRFVEDIESIDGKNYLFLNAFQNNLYSTINSSAN